MNYETIARLFGLTLAKGVDGKEEITLANWIPVSIEASDLKTSNVIGMAMENPIHDVFTRITSAAELIDALQLSPLLMRMDEAMQKKVSAIT